MAKGLVLAWRAADAQDHRIYTSYFDFAVGSWELPRELVGSRTNNAPQLCNNGPGGPLMTHKGEIGDDTFRRFIGNGIVGISPQIPCSQHLRSSWNISAVARTSGGFLCAWKGPTLDNRIRFSTDAFSSINPNVRIFDSFTSYTTPALATLGNAVYMFWRGNDDDNIYWARSHPTDLGWDAYTIYGAHSFYAPAVAVFNNTLIAVWRGGGQRLWWSFFEGGTSWSDPTEIPGTIASAYRPTLTVVGDRLYMAWHGTDDNPQIYWAYTTGGSWSIPRGVPGAFTFAVPALGTFG